MPTLTKSGDYQPIYRTTTPEDTSYHSLRIAADNDPEKPLAYARITGTSQAKGYVVRVSKYNYFQYRYGFEPSFVMGTNSKGQDIFTRLASAARFSFMLAIFVSSLNLTIGTFYGAIEGYYGGWVDMLMERIADVLGGIPFIVVTSLFQLHLSNKVGVVPSLLFAFVLTGWLGMAYRVRKHRLEGQEYVFGLHLGRKRQEGPCLNTYSPTLLEPHYGLNSCYSWCYFLGVQLNLFGYCKP